MEEIKKYTYWYRYLKNGVIVGELRVKRFCHSYWYFLDDFSVKRKYRNQRFGTMLFNKVANEFKDKHLFLLVEIKNIKALSIYIKNEFKVVKVDPPYYIMANTLDDISYFDDMDIIKE